MNQNDKVITLRKIAEEINSPLSVMDIGLLIEYGQTGEPHSFDDYMLIKNIWDILNGKECNLHNLGLLICSKSEPELEKVSKIVQKYMNH